MSRDESLDVTPSLPLKATLRSIVPALFEPNGKGLVPCKSAYRLSRDRHKPWAYDEYPMELIDSSLTKVLLHNQVDTRHNGVYFTDLKVGTLFQVTYTGEGGWRVNGQSVCTEDWIGSDGWFPDRWSIYRQYPKPSMASGGGWSKR